MNCGRPSLKPLAGKKTLGFRLGFFVLVFSMLSVAACSTSSVSGEHVSQNVTTEIETAEELLAVWEGVGGIDGDIGGTGIVGTITGFGSIIVNGIHIQINNQQSVSTAYGSIKAKDLKLGHVVAVSLKESNGKIVASGIELYQPVIGAIEQIDYAQRQLTVAGLEVNVGEDAEGLNFAKLKTGDQIAISALESSQGLYAQRIDPTPKRDLVVMTGTVKEAKDRKFSLGTKTLDIIEKSPQPFRPGDHVRVIGQLRGNDVRVNRTQKRGNPFNGQVRNWIAEQDVEPSLKRPKPGRPAALFGIQDRRIREFGPFNPPPHPRKGMGMPKVDGAQGENLPPRRSGQGPVKTGDMSPGPALKPGSGPGPGPGSGTGSGPGPGRDGEKPGPRPRRP